MLGRCFIYLSTREIGQSLPAGCRQGDEIRTVSEVGDGIESAILAHRLFEQVKGFILPTEHRVEGGRVVQLVCDRADVVESNAQANRTAIGKPRRVSHTTRVIAQSGSATRGKIASAASMIPNPMMP